MPFKAFLSWDIGFVKSDFAEALSLRKRFRDPMGITFSLSPIPRHATNSIP